MANIHAINAQGTEYGIIAENGISQVQSDTIATIGDVADLTTTAKTTLVSAVNEVNGKLLTEQVIYENSNPVAPQASMSISVTGVTNAKALKITYGMCSSTYGGLKEEVFPLLTNVLNEFYLSQTYFNDSDEEFVVATKVVALSSSRSSIDVSSGYIYTYNVNEETREVVQSNDSEKIIKITALF